MASNKRERELARMRAERQAARRAAAEQRRRQRNAVIASVLAVALIGGAGTVLALSLTGGDDDTPDTLANPAPSATPAVNTADSCAYTDTGDPSGDKKVELPPSTGVERVKTYTAVLDTNRGKITFDLDAKKAPCTSNNLRSLAHFAYFDGTTCHRLVTEGIFVVQCGDPTGKGSGGPGYQFPDENLEGATYPAGTVAMANSGPGTNGSQFFLVYKDTQLPPNYTPFGTITSGLDALLKVAAGGTESGEADGKPKLALDIKALRTRLKA